MVTTPARTAFDLGRQADRTAAVIAIDALLHQRVIPLAELAAIADTHVGWRGVMRFRRVLELAEPGAASPMETRLRLIIVDAGLPRPVAQVEIRRNGRFVARVDLAYPDLRLAIEYEGDHHRDRSTYRRDIVRFNALRAAGWAALRFTADDVFRRPQRIVDDVRVAIADQTARLR